MCFFFNVCTLFSGARGFFRALSAAGHAGGPPVHQGASLGPGRAPWRALWAFQVAKFGKYSRGYFLRSQSRARQRKTHMSAVLLHCRKSSLLGGSHGTRAVAHQVCVDNYYACVDIAYACLLCAMTRVRVCRCVQVCVLVCWNPTFQLCFFALSACLLLLLPYHVSIRPSLKLSTSLLCGCRGTTAVAQQKVVWTATYCACVEIAYASVLFVGVCRSVDSYVCWHPTFQLSFLFCLVSLLVAAAVAVLCLYHTVTQALELSTLWQPRYNSTRTTSLCGPLLCVCWHCI